jgi:ribosome-binding factor A
MKKAHIKTPTQRQLRVSEELRHILSQLFERDILHDPLIFGRSLTVTEVRMSPDLKNATAFISLLGGGETSELIEALNRAAPFLRHKMSSLLRLRALPQIKFVADISFDEANRIDELLNAPEVRKDLIGTSEK